jgi:hypothetical protein
MNKNSTSHRGPFPTSANQIEPQQPEGILTMKLNGLIVFIVICIPTLAGNAQVAKPNNHADANLVNYFEAETRKLADACLTNLSTLEDWQSKQKIYRQQLFDMLGLDPLPAKTDLKPEITQTVER